MAVTVKYEIVEYRLAQGYVCKGRIRHSRVAHLKDIVKEVAQRGTTASEPDIESIVWHVVDVMTDYLVRGVIVDTPLGRFRLTIRGTFRSPDDRFDPKRHDIDIKVIPAREMRKRISRDVRLAREMATFPAPDLFFYYDTVADCNNSILTPGGLGQIRGKNLHFERNDPEQGIAFIAEDRSITWVRLAAKNKPGELIFMVPDLAPGRYRLEVHALVSGQVRTGYLDETLTVDGGKGMSSSPIDILEPNIPAWPEE